jgi:ATP/maltotriose-dependent transcriptional regulator MalT/DNA-binding SARP family transcriptional activator
MPTSDHPAVDTALERYVSFASPPSAARDAPFAEFHVPVSVGPGPSPAQVSAHGVSAERGPVERYPVHPAKVQCPPPRDDTLARSRLLDWLASKIHHRVLFVVAEAGYGKTTLLVDFSRRTRLRTLWYRLDSHDRDWVAFLTHLVAAGREHDPSFASGADALLRQIGGASPTREAVTEAFARDVVALGGEGAVFILDDYHAVDESPDVRSIVGELVAHAPERVTFIFSSRRQPSVRVARLRALGEVAELSTEDLRFNEPETEQLFRESYGRPLDRDVIGDLSSRTEGWAASLQLVQAALRDRTAGEVRTFVRSLTGAEGDLYDYLAEEVIGDLPEDLQAFLMNVSVLENVDPRFAAAAAGVDAATAAGYLASAEQVGVLGRRGRAADGSRSFHPLVRDFLRARLAREAGEANAVATHLRIAEAAEALDWKVACFHYGAAGRPEDVHRILRSSLQTVMGSGQFQVAASYLERYPPPELDAAFEAVRARAEFETGRLAEGLSRAEHAFGLNPRSDDAGINLLPMRFVAADYAGAARLARSIAGRTTDSVVRSIATASTDMIRLAVDGNLSRFVKQVMAMAAEHRRLGLHRYEGISLLNAAAALRSQGDAEAALEHATRAVDLLSANAGFEQAAARVERICALAHLGRSGDATRETAELLTTLDLASRAEALTELGLLQLRYGDPAEASVLLDAAPDSMRDRRDMVGTWRAAIMERAIRERDFAAARAARPAADERCGEMGFTAHCLALDAYLAVVEERADAAAILEPAVDLAGRQDAFFWSRYCRLLAAALAPRDEFASRARIAVDGHRVHLSIVAELVIERLADCDDALLQLVSAETQLRPERWRSPLRVIIDAGKSNARWRAGQLLGEIGEQQDVARLRTLGRSARGRPAIRALGRSLSRKLAPHVFVEDQGRVAVRVGDRIIQGGEVRRKVLALLCFLLSRHGLSATRDQVLDALWPDVDPTVALNSLNQTVYFLRRVFEPEFSDELSPGYVQHDSNVLWLDDELVSARTGSCWELIRLAGSSASASAIETLASTYVGKFALDFAYEEWAIAYRDSLHAAYLQIVETAVTRDMAAGAFDRAIDLARRALSADPDAEQIEVSLLRLYRLSGAHSAAAEQYSHYANAIRREIGVEAPPIEMV